MEIRETMASVCKAVDNTLVQSEWPPVSDGGVRHYQSADSRRLCSCNCSQDKQVSVILNDVATVKEHEAREGHHEDKDCGG